MYYERSDYYHESILRDDPEDVKTELLAARNAVSDLKKEVERLKSAYEVIEELEMEPEETEYVFTALSEKRMDRESELSEWKEAYLALKEQYEDIVCHLTR